MKKILSLILVLGLLVTLPVMLLSCDGNGEETEATDASDTNAPTSENTYTVTVVDGEGAPLSGVTLMITNSTSVFISGVTDANGKFSTDVTDTEGVGVMITKVPDGYVKPEATSGVLHAVFGNEKNATVTVEKVVEEKTTYTVYIVDQNGDAVEGATVQFCTVKEDGSVGSCLATTLVKEENGVYTLEYTPDTIFIVKILEIADGYTKPDAINDDGYHGQFEESETELTLTVTKN